MSFQVCGLMEVPPQTPPDMLLLKVTRWSLAPTDSTARLRANRLRANQVSSSTL